MASPRRSGSGPFRALRRAFPFGHLWAEDPRFTMIPTRRCRRCGRVESTAFTGKWRRFPYPETHENVGSGNA